jgi:hypothetical protein
MKSIVKEDTSMSVPVPWDGLKTRYPQPNNRARKGSRTSMRAACSSGSSSRRRDKRPLTDNTRRLVTA